MFWKLINWLNLCPELLALIDHKSKFHNKDGGKNVENPDNPKPSTPPKQDLSTKFLTTFGFTKDGDNTEAKKNLLKALLIASSLLTIYFVAFHNRVYDIKIKSIACKSGSSNVLTFTSLADDTYDVDLTNFQEHAYSEKLSNNAGQSIQKIFLTTNNRTTFSFNVGQTNSTTATELASYFALDNGCQIKWDCTVAGASGCCGTGTKCSCSSGTGTCNCTGSSSSNCSCCCAAKIINFAILHPSNPNKITFGSVFFSLLPTILYLGVFIFIMRSTMKAQGGLYGKNSIFKIGKSISHTAKTKITFKEVAGLIEEKEELEEIVDYLKNPFKYTSMGARTPKGLILYGPPGTGKTLLAKAVSGEANVPFIEASGASFDDMFVGVGAKRVRELFEKAKKLAPCIIFIDEIDAVAAKRGDKHTMGGSSDQTINQLLSEMDGFNTKAGIVVIAATNRLSTIDEAILRPGRFDRHIMISLPDIRERLQILKIHAKNKNISSGVSFDDVARKTPGFSGAQLENVLNEATLLTVRDNKKVVGMVEINEAIDRVMAGPAKKERKISESERRQIAYHEAGHAITGIYSKDGEVVEKITIIPRGRAAGYVLSAPEKQENILQTKQSLQATLLTMLGGRAAEEIFFGEDNVGSGASNDLYKATRIAREMVTKLGMSKKLGLVQHVTSEEAENPYKHSYSSDVGNLIDQEIKDILDTAFIKAKEIISNNKEEFLLIVETLLLLETIDKKQIDYIHANKLMPPEAIEFKQKQQENKKAQDIGVEVINKS